MRIQRIPWRIISFMLVIFPDPVFLFSQPSDTLKGLYPVHPNGSTTEDTLVHPPGNDVQTMTVVESLQRRQERMDSLLLLQKELPALLNAWFRTEQEGIMLKADRIDIIGDSILSDYTYTILPFNTIDPFRPWQMRYAMGDKSIKIGVNKNNKQIESIRASFLNASFQRRDKLLVISEKSKVMSHYSEKFYLEPVDSVFLDQNNRVIGVKKYARMFTVINGNQKGQSLFDNFMQELKYVYGADDQITQYQIVKYCERWKTYDPRKICSTLTYTLVKKGNNYELARKNQPANPYADGTYSYSFDEHNNLKSISFQNEARTENWQREIELNKEGNVNCYFDKVQGTIRQSLCMIYHQNDPGAKNKVETITTTFEENGISYFQKNNTTGKSRTRNKMTLEWGPWK